MARGDVRIDYETNDLIIEKSSDNAFDSIKHRFDVSLDSVVLTVTIPSRYSENDLWKTYKAHVDNIDSIDPSYDSKSLLIEYSYINGLGLEVFLGQFNSIGFVSTSSPSFLTVGSFKQLLSEAKENNQSARFKYFYSEKSESFYYSIQECLGQTSVGIELTNQSQSFTVDWGDGNSDIITGSNINIVHTYSVSGDYVIVVKDIDMSFIEGIDVNFTAGNSGRVSGISISDKLVNLKKLALTKTNLKSIKIPDVLTNMEHFVLTDNTELSELVLPQTLTKLSNVELQFAPKLTKLITYPEFRYSKFILFDLALDAESINMVINNAMISDYRDVGAILILLSGTNAIPDETSGGINGLQAWSNLIYEGDINVQVNGSPTPLPFVPYQQIETPKQTDPVNPIPDSKEAIIVSKVVMGDFVVEDSVSQNEYILLNIDEGSYLQSPISGVGLRNYLQSPSGGQEMVDVIVSKFSLDNLGIVQLDINDSTISITSEPLEK